MKALKILVVITAVVVTAGLTADAWALDCQPAVQFRSLGKDTIQANNVKIGTLDSGADDTGNSTIGRIWDSDDAGNANTGLEDLSAGTDGTGFGTACPPSAFYQNAAGNRKFNEFMGSVTCKTVNAGCPTSKMTIAVEHYPIPGPPGIGETAYYTAYMVAKAEGSRPYNYGAVDGLTVPTTIPLLQFPDVVITGSSRVGANVQISYNNVDQTNMIHTWNVDQVFPTNAVITEWQLVKATGADPGRLRSDGWVIQQSTPYVPGGTPASFVVPCSSDVTDELVAIGIGFNGGTSIIDSALVGKAISLECDPNVAQPELTNVGPKPTTTEKKRSSGRR